MLMCSECSAIVSDNELIEAIEIVGPGHPTICTGCAREIAQNREQAEQRMVELTTPSVVPSDNDRLYGNLELPAKFKYLNETDAGEVMQYVMSCGICNKLVYVTFLDYVNDVTPVCKTCEATAKRVSAGEIIT